MKPSATPPPTEPRRHFLVQAPVEPVGADGLGVVLVGTMLFAVAAVVTGIFRADLQARGNGWWLWVLIAGFGLGLIGLAYSLNRRRKRRAGGPVRG